MSGHELLLDRVEFLTIYVKRKRGDFEQSKPFPQLKVEDEKIEYLTRGELIYLDDAAEDPRYFGLIFGVKVKSDPADEKSAAPYDIEVETMGFFRYKGDEFIGEDRFRCVRLSGYQILYGAIREMVSNLTARSRHGTWSLPAKNFHLMAKADAKQDEADRQRRLKKVTSKAVPVVRQSKADAASSLESSSPPARKRPRPRTRLVSKE